jgi:hypothetical protein
VKDVGTDRQLWVFNAFETKDPGGVFATRRSAEIWIARSKLTGNLTQYPLDMGVYDWALEMRRFEPLDEYQRSPGFISNFSSGSQPFYAYRRGEGGDIGDQTLGSEEHTEVEEDSMADQMAGYEKVWVFTGEKAEFPSGIFSKRSLAEAWIKRNSLSGTLTKYPVDIAAYDWALSTKVFTPKREDQRSPSFIARFSSANQEHYHYENGAGPGTFGEDEKESANPNSVGAPASE